jgi:hypothetical protein
MRSWNLVVSVLLTQIALGAAPPPRPPNIVLILCDNLGYGDLEVYNPQAKQPTPRLNQLAREGRLAAFGSRTVTTQPSLYHLADDLQETANVHDRHPEIVARTEQHLARIRAELGELDRRGPGCRPIGQVATPAPRVLPATQR